MTDNDALEQVRERLTEGNLGESIRAMENFLMTHPQQHFADRLPSIQSDYQLMTDYWRRGFKDAQLTALYQNMLQRMYTLYGSVAVDYDVSHSHFLSSIRQRVNGAARDWSPQQVREMLESFVSEVALLALEPEHTAEARREALFREHHRQMTALFAYILTSDMWTDGFGQAMEEILLSPTVDTADQQLIVSSVMLSAKSCFDIVKFRLLINVYRRTLDEHVRQRALVGWVFSADAEVALWVYPEEVSLVESLLEDEHCCQELSELQKQVFYCINAERDHETIQQEIMPDLLKNQGFKVTRNGIEEVEDDPLHDILHPDEEEQNLERVEASFQRMMEMQKQGSDIYFGGFSRMKGFPFFNEISNWFVPFSVNHPDVSEALKRLGNNRFLQSLLEKGPFCDSDKYSFLLAFEQVMSRIPQNLREMMERGEASLQEIEETEMQRPAYIRRLYLQDLYRFFRVSPRRVDFWDIFSLSRQTYLFFANPIFMRTQLELRFNEMVSFLIKKRYLGPASDILANYGDYRKDFQFYMMAGYVTQCGFDLSEEGYKRSQDAAYYYGRALELQPDHERALSGYARALFDRGQYQEALDAYDRLVKLQPKRTYLLNKAVCQTRLHNYADAQQLLFRLNYEDSDDLKVKRVLAWTLTCDGKYEQAIHLYGQLLSVEKPLMEDLLNYGYCLWFDGKVDEAADCFHRYLSETLTERQYIVTNEAELIRSKGISEPEMQMMLDIL